MLANALDHLDSFDAVLGRALDGGWWGLGLRDPCAAHVLRTVPTSRPDTGARTHNVLHRRGYAVGPLPTMSDVDTIDDARHVAAMVPGQPIRHRRSRGDHVLSVFEPGLLDRKVSLGGHASRQTSRCEAVKYQAVRKGRTMVIDEDAHIGKHVGDPLDAEPVPQRRYGAVASPVDTRHGGTGSGVRAPDPRQRRASAWRAVRSSR